ncbi:CD15/CS22/SEF14 family fimbrial major subunit, partial [Salmonella enterica subsp. enterica serovar Paratyphi A]
MLIVDFGDFVICVKSASAVAVLALIACGSAYAAGFVG